MSDQKYKSTLLFGAPGVGKGTQGKILGHVPGFIHISMGDIFRSLDRESRLGKVFVEYSSAGELVPDDVTVEIWSESMQGMIDAGEYNPAKHVLVLDGIPRNPDQARLLEDRIDVLRIISLTAVDEDAMVERLRKRALSSGRADDAKDEVIRRRWEVYRAETAPVLGCYSPELIKEIDAMGTPAEVFIEVLSGLAPIQKEAFGNVLA